MATQDHDEVFDQLARVKQADRDALKAITPEAAQQAVDAVLHPGLWRVPDPEQLAWPGDLADDEAD